jgi:hypothetical protein
MFNKKNKQKIIFQEATDAAKYILEIPKPATNYVPEWYRSQKLFSNGQNNILKSKDEPASGTYKLCVPLIDSLTSGYCFVTPCDIVVTNKSKNGYAPQLEWGIDSAPLDMQDAKVLGNFPIPTGHNETSFRWNTDWKIITPKGYSVWITHPTQRYDLPFTTLGAFIDTDKHPNRIITPFFVKDGFEGIIPEGTPIAQIIPIKRDSWVSEKKPYENGTEYIFKNIMRTKVMRVYKTKFWSKKEYR